MCGMVAINVQSNMSKLHYSPAKHKYKALMLEGSGMEMYFAWARIQGKIIGFRSCSATFTCKARL